MRKVLYLLGFLLVAQPAAAQLPDLSQVKDANGKSVLDRALESFNPPLEWDQCRVNGQDINDGPLLDQFCGELVELDNQMKGKFALRAIYMMNKIDPHFGALFKNGGAHTPFDTSQDFALYNGDRALGWGVDLATTKCCNEHGKRFVVPTWQPSAPDRSNPEEFAKWLDRWRQPTAEMAGLAEDPNPGGNTGGGTTPTSGGISQESLDKAVAAALAEAKAYADAGDKKTNERIDGLVKKANDQFEQAGGMSTIKKILILLGIGGAAAAGATVAN